MQATGIERGQLFYSITSNNVVWYLWFDKFRCIFHNVKTSKLTLYTNVDNYVFYSLLKTLIYGKTL